jgi:hypothetical protein
MKEDGYYWAVWSDKSGVALVRIFRGLIEYDGVWQDESEFCAFSERIEPPTVEDLLP